MDAGEISGGHLADACICATTIKKNLMQKLLGLSLWIVLLARSIFIQAADFNVTASAFDSSYTISGQAFNPTLELTRGQTYTFAINSDPIHPFVISTEEFDFNVPGVSNNDINQGTITYAVPLDAPDTMIYLCSLHFFGGTINIIDPPLPPVPNVKIISISMTSSNVTLKSVGTNGWTGIPEFSSNLFSTTWSVVPNYTNTFSNGTNTTVFNRLEAICGPNVFLRVKNTPN
jgi:hypothetical protein